MDQTPPLSEHPAGRERLLKSAIRLFSRDGFDGTSVRAVAEDAGLSWGLVRFYFGSKDGLRDAAEEYVISGYLQRVRDAGSATSSEELTTVIEAQAEGLSEVARFLRRAILEERPIALQFVRELLSTTEALLSENRARFPDEPALWDPVRSVAHRLGYLFLAPQIETLLGRDLFTVEELKLRNLQESRFGDLAIVGKVGEHSKPKPRRRP